ncbi:uncharacterized protein LOC130556260 isoform X2 [Triplophysa rosa]|uniref:Uncharacterized protein n=1 Tax=Triplophysa rosa TaxID=992332 RepID=A0A9W7WSA4_TRIRA|nr:uncharacterized protein LOC130556260 isoform X2 [Triplophysa rosa]KAI7807409.1 hypothetical protein IRJ41_003456 [Triplophysa rosa]
MKDISSKVSIRPFTSDKDLAERTRPANVKREKLGFLTLTLKKPRSLRPYEPTQHRMKWPKEVEKMPTLDIINKASSSALVGGALSNTKTTQWYSSSSNNNKNMILGAFKEGDEPFILPGSTGEVIAQQFHRGITLRICTSEPYKRTKNSPPEKNSNKDFVLEHVPLCFDDELERQNVNVLIARPPTVYSALPIVSETYPVIYNTDQYQHEPFKSPGFHFLETPKPLLQNCCVLNSKSHCAVIRNIDSMQDPRSQRSQRSIGILCPQNSPHIGNKTMRARSVHVLLADGNVTKYPNNSPLFVRRHDVASPGVFSNATRSPPVPFLMPRKRSTQVHVGPVVNGINPIPNQDAKRSPSDKMTTGKLTRCSHVTPPQSQRSVAKQNGTDFLVISKALQSQLKSDQKPDFDTKQHFHEEFWSREIENISHNYEMSQVTDDKHFGLNDESLSRPSSSAKHTFQDQAPEISTLDMLRSVDDSNTCSETMGSVTPKSNHDVQWSHAINVPTAESCE